MATALCVLVCLLIGVQRLGGVKTLHKLSVQRGGSAVVPCHYDEKYVSQVKYWCRGYTWDTCRVLLRSSSVPSPPDTRVSISDDITQRVFTVTMRNLQDTDSDVYWCAVDITGPDDKAYLKITVTPGPPELYSESSVFSGPVGGVVLVRCFYGDRLRSGEKKWCRSGTSVCLTAGRTSRLYKYALDTDPRTGALSVTIRDLRPADQGWYWCTGGDTQLPVYVAVSTKTNTPTVTQREKTSTTHTTTAVQTARATLASEAPAPLQTSVEATPHATQTRIR
ncbi:polymeric immunoglobulin receptor-like [Sardina pilchardus]|uniref:polymeric immunoglobulin receptor-like n=1 Tax=Sardina pilchardus TaxID=27697 RepID=UPI002E0F9BC0